MESLYPGIKERLVEDGQIRPNISVAIDGEVGRMGLLEKVGQDSEVHFVPAIGGGGPDGRRKYSAGVKGRALRDIGTFMGTVCDRCRLVLE